MTMSRLPPSTEHYFIKSPKFTVNIEKKKGPIISPSLPRTFPFSVKLAARRICPPSEQFTLII